jgi:hypothetical protein
MNIARRAILGVVAFTLLPLAVPAFAADSWDGTWTGLWGGADETAITIEGGKVVTYSFKGTTQPVETESADGKQIRFGTKLFSIVLARSGETTAKAQFVSNTMGQTTAELTRR